MRRIVDWNALDAQGRDELLQRPAQKTGADVATTVAALLDQIRTDGDEALRQIGARLDGVALDRFEVSGAEFEAAAAALAPALKAAIIEAAARIERFHRVGAGETPAVETAPGVVCQRI